MAYSEPLQPLSLVWPDGGVGFLNLDGSMFAEPNINSLAPPVHVQRRMYPQVSTAHVNEHLRKYLSLQ